MKNSLKTVSRSIKHWYFLLIAGLIFIGLGIWMFTAMAATYVALSFVFSIAFLVAGLSEIFFSLSSTNELENWGWTLTFGIVTALLGFLLLLNPGLSMVTLALYVGFIVLFRSIGAIGFALDLKHYGAHDWGLLMTLGVLGILFSFILLWNPLFAGLTLVIWTGIVLISAGIFSLYASLRLRKLNKLTHEIGSHVHA